MTPLHYVPWIIRSGALFSARELRARGLPIRPRPSVAARDRKHGLDRFVHLSTTPRTPLSDHKRALGYPHAIFSFRREPIAAIPGVVALRFNPKSWRHRDDFVPLSDLNHADAAASGEILVPDTLPIAPSLAIGLHAATEIEADLLRRALPELETLSIECTADWFAPLAVAVSEPLRDYLTLCGAGVVLPPPDIAFD